MSRWGEPSRVIVADDHTMFREALQEVLESHPDIDVVDTAGSADEAVARTARWRPDIVLLDVQMPGGDATATVRRLREVSAETRVVVLSMHDAPRLVHELLREGVSAYLHKSASREELLSTIGSIRADSSRVIVSVARTSLASGGNGPEEGLSDREREVLVLVAQALSNAQIATRLKISQGTVKRHLRNVFTKLGAVSRIDAVNKAVSGLLITPPGHERGRPPSTARHPGGRAAPPG
jgi:DNA-binding NarL/FixJ family response regulator